MIFMGMSKQDGIQVLNARTQHLTTKIRRRIDDELRSSAGNEDTASEAGITWIG